MNIEDVQFRKEVAKLDKLAQKEKTRDLLDIFQEMCDICQDAGMHPDEINKVADEWNRIHRRSR